MLRALTSHESPSAPWTAAERLPLPVQRIKKQGGSTALKEGTIARLLIHVAYRSDSNEDDGPTLVL